MADVLILSRSEAERVFTMKDALEAVEEAYRAQGEGKVINPMATSFVVPGYNGEVDIKSAYIESMNCSGLKFAGGYWDNPVKYGLPSVIGVILIADGSNGMPLAIMDGTHVGAYRTGAAGGVAAKYLARKESEKVAIIGTGNQGRLQLMALLENFDIRKVYAYDRDKARRAAYAEEMTRKTGVEVVSLDEPRKAVAQADIVVTATPATEAIVFDDWVRPGTHINAIGADMPGKQELDPLIFKRAKAVVDLREQCVEIGEIQNPIREGVITELDIYAEIGEIVAGKRKGRLEDNEITVFDSTGLGIQDVGAAYRAYVNAKNRNIGKKIKFF